MYKAKVIENIDNGKGYWNSQLIGIFNDKDERVGEFKRNYGSYGVSTFAPFKVYDQWYALYSENYVEISLMELPSCKKITSCGGGPGGFCPVEIWVPSYKEVTYDMEGGTREDGSTYEPHSFKYRFYDNQSFGGEEDYKPEPHEIQYENFALVSGCVWGDDSSWKVIAIDLSKIWTYQEKKKTFKGRWRKIKIDQHEPFGYIELANKSKLRDIEIDAELLDGSKWEYSFNIPTQQRFYINKISDTRYEKYESWKNVYDVGNNKE